jgi:hypothetical protein
MGVCPPCLIFSRVRGVTALLGMTWTGPVRTLIAASRTTRSILVFHRREIQLYIECLCRCRAEYPTD